MRSPLLIALGAAALATAAPSAGFAASPEMNADFLRKAVQGDTTEIRMGEMAEKMAASPKVKDLGAKLVHDHTEARSKALAAAKSMGVMAPETVSPDGAKTADQLAKLSGPAFDRAWLKDAVQDHKKDVSAYRKEIKSGSGPAQQHAREILPVIQQHLQMAEAVQKGMGG